MSHASRLTPSNANRASAGDFLRETNGCLYGHVYDSVDEIVYASPYRSLSRYGFDMRDTGTSGRVCRATQWCRIATESNEIHIVHSATRSWSYKHRCGCHLRPKREMKSIGSWVHEHRRMDGWSDGQTEGRKESCTDEWTNEWMHERTNEWSLIDRC